VRSRAGRYRSIALGVLLAIVVLAVAPGGLPGARGASYPVLPLGLDRAFLENLSGAELAPGASGALGFRVGNPLAVPMDAVEITAAVYAFNAFPGNATSTVAVSTAPVLSNGTASGLEVNESLGTLAPGAVRPLSIPVVASSTSPAGTFAVRTALRFVANGSAYLLESRGWFTAAAWATATAGPNGSVDLNVSALGVSGVLPETSVLVQSTGLTEALWAILGVGLVVIAVGAYWYYRRSNSSAGT
jgi:hypothetical protein